MENGLVFVRELREASNSSDKSADDTHPSLKVILSAVFLQCLYSVSHILTNGFDMFNSTAQTANEIKSSSDHSKTQI